MVLMLQALQFWQQVGDTEGTRKEFHFIFNSFHV